jgi:WD40 repeat protein
VVFSPNGALIASASKDETVKIWNNSMYNLKTKAKLKLI